MSPSVYVPIREFPQSKNRSKEPIYDHQIEKYLISRIPQASFKSDVFNKRKKSHKEFNERLNRDSNEEKKMEEKTNFE